MPFATSRKKNPRFFLLLPILRFLRYPFYTRLPFSLNPRCLVVHPQPPFDIGCHVCPNTPASFPLMVIFFLSLANSLLPVTLLQPILPFVHNRARHLCAAPKSPNSTILPPVASPSAPTTTISLENRMARLEKKLEDMYNIICTIALKIQPEIELSDT
jgi:hypothetical protein